MGVSSKGSMVQETLVEDGPAIPSRSRQLGDLKIFENFEALYGDENGIFNQSEFLKYSGISRKAEHIFSVKMQFNAEFIRIRQFNLSGFFRLFSCVQQDGLSKRIKIFQQFFRWNDLVTSGILCRAISN